MSKHVNEWLDAYHDGELRGMRLRRVEQHLETCAMCRAELESLRSLSSLLQVQDPEVEFLSPERFADNLALQLPRRGQQPQTKRGGIGWWLVPACLLAIGVVLEITYTLSTVVSIAADTTIFSGQLAWLQGEPLGMEWFATAMRLFGDQMGSAGQLILRMLNDINVFIAQFVRHLLPQALLAAGYLGWMFAWWLRQQDTPHEELRGSDPQSDTHNGF